MARSLNGVGAQDCGVFGGGRQAAYGFVDEAGGTRASSVAGLTGIHSVSAEPAAMDAVQPRTL